MKQICYILYALWIVSAIVLKILGFVSWWVATSWIWFPLAMVLVALTGINLSVWIGARMKAKEESKIPDSCETCLFGQTSEYAEDKKCLGCVLDPNHKRGELCNTYKRNIQR